MVAKFYKAYYINANGERLIYDSHITNVEQFKLSVGRMYNHLGKDGTGFEFEGPFTANIIGKQYHQLSY